MFDKAPTINKHLSISLNYVLNEIQKTRMNYN